jgi:hypothetical protein
MGHAHKRMAHMRGGGAGQAVVQFAHGVNDGLDYALKFYLSKKAAIAEGELYKNEALGPLLPNAETLCMNEEGEETDAHGVPLPPFLIMEKGEALDEWSQRAKPDQFMAVAVRMHACTACICCAWCADADVRSVCRCWPTSRRGYTTCMRRALCTATSSRAM